MSGGKRRREVVAEVRAALAVRAAAREHAAEARGRRAGPSRRTVRSTCAATASGSHTGEPSITSAETCSGSRTASERASAPPRLCPIRNTGPTGLGGASSQMRSRGVPPLARRSRRWRECRSSQTRCPRRRSHPRMTDSEESPAMKPGISSTGGASGCASGRTETAVGQQPGELAAVAHLSPNREGRRLCEGGLSGHGAGCVARTARSGAGSASPWVSRAATAGGRRTLTQRVRAIAACDKRSIRHRGCDRRRADPQHGSDRARSGRGAAFAAAHGLADAAVSALAHEPALQGEILAGIEPANAGLSRRQALPRFGGLVQFRKPGYGL